MVVCRMTQRKEDTERFYELLMQLENRVGGKRKLAECNGRMKWPARGVYFFFEDGEFRSDSQADLRVVRVGTHAVRRKANTKLWRRLYEHRYHNGASVFRSLVRTSLTRKGAFGTDDPRRKKDQLVTDYIGKMPFLWVNVSDEPGPSSQRAFIEKNSIALLSDYDDLGVDKQSMNWLGQHSNKENVRKSGMWNSDYVARKHSSVFLDVLERRIELTNPLKS